MFFSNLHMTLRGIKNSTRKTQEIFSFTHLPLLSAPVVVGFERALPAKPKS